MMVFLKGLAVLAGLYALVLLIMALAQTALLFPRWAMGASPALPSGAVALRVARPDGVTLAGYRLPALATGTEPEPEPVPLVLGFGGNAWDGAALVLYLRQAFPGHDVVAFHYRGYGLSGGRPSAEALMSDAVAVYDHLTQGQRVVLVGFSIGAGPAAHLARARPVVGVVLVTGFDSLHALAREHYPWAPAGWLLRHRMEPAADLAQAGAPVALITAAHDTIIPAARTEALRIALSGAEPGIVFDHVVEGGHNDIYGRAELLTALRDAMLVMESR